MRSHLKLRAWNHLYAAWKWSSSLLKRDWQLSGYPILIRQYKVDPNHKNTRIKQHRYTAQIVNWWAMGGGGETPPEALEELQKRFDLQKTLREKERRPLPRPGTHVPIEFASRERITAHSELAEDFLRRVLHLSGAFISDESSLWDFHQAEDNRALLAKIKEVYGADVSDIESGKISEILGRIASKRLPR